MRRIINLGLLCLAALFSLSPASAQDLQNFKPAVGTWNYFSVEGARLAEEGVFVPSLYLNYGQNPLAWRDQDDQFLEAVISKLSTLNILAAYGISERIELGLDLPLNLSIGGDGLEALGGEEGFSLGDPRLLPKLRLLGGEGERFGLSFSLPISLPLGDPKKFSSDDGLVLQPRLAGEVHLGALSLALNLGYRYRAENLKLENLEIGDEISYGAGAALALMGEDLQLLAEIYGAIPVEADEDKGTFPLEGLLGARLFTDWCGAFSLGAGMGLIPDYGAPDLRLLGSFSWICMHRDRDSDGLEDKLDKCPEQAEDKDGFKDKDGCPDKDNDNDGVLDGDDRCPDLPEDQDGFEDKDGCSDPDNDQDGILDISDDCPDKAEDLDTFEDTDGCPDTDNDQDAVLDENDKCPNSSEDADGFEDEDGCPDKDNDKDGIFDSKDKCPNKPEVINGIEDEDGCPDEGESKINFTAKKIEILDKVYFASSKAKIQKRSYAVLDQVAAVLKNRPQLKGLRIEGHTDLRGDPDKNLKLSQARAEAVKSYLVKRGVKATRLEAKGYGGERPLAPGKGKKDSAKNRRVEFVILD